MSLISYLLTSTVSLSIFFLAYKIIYRNENNFKQLRLFLLISIVVSLLLPLNKVRIETNFSKAINNEPVETTQITKINENIKALNNQADKPNQKLTPESSINIFNFLFWAYVAVSSILIIRIILQLLAILYQFASCKKLKKNNSVIVSNSGFKNTFSFFNIVFINESSSCDEDLEKILAHENIHVHQMHSIDLLLIELLSAVMWFNPLVWMLRREIQLVHEYLADEGALSTGIDRLRYQALLINQVTEESLICLSSSFNHSLIKKRMIMMTNSKINHRTKLKILALVPLATVLFLGIACVNGQQKNDVVTALIAPVKMNVLYIGVDNPMKLAVSGYEPSVLSVAIDNGTIEGHNGEYNAKPKEKGAAVITVSSNGKEILRTTFRVKYVPDPVAKLAGIKGAGSIEKSELLKQSGIYAEIEGFDFDLGFQIKEFTVTIMKNGKTIESNSNSDKFTSEQKQLISEIKAGEKLYIENVKAQGPDGTLRLLGSIMIILK